VIHFSKSSRITSETLRFSARAFRQAAYQSSSEMRMLRAVVPLDNCGLEVRDDRLGVLRFFGGDTGVVPAVGDAEAGAVSDAFGVGVVDGVEMLGRVGGPGEFQFGGHGGPFGWCTHTLTHGVPTPQEEAS
jgi:hypothetical protein